MNVYIWVAPFVFALIAAEFIYCLIKKNGYYSFQDSLMGLGTMAIAQCVNLAVAVAVLYSYDFIYQNFAFFHFEPTLMHYLLGYIGVDFLFYWFHRAGHRINILWAAHVPHHSAEELNYAVALRASFTQRAASFLFYWPLALLGFSTDLVLTLVAINLVFQLLPHTRVIPKLPTWIDSWLNTPYHHRMHHAANPIYWDKNYGGTFIIWDKLFGTYVDETEEPYYGVTIHPASWDPTYLNAHWFHVLWKDMWAAKTLREKFLIWFKPPGWRPSHLPPYDKEPAKSAATQVKFQTQALAKSNPYLIGQLIPIFAMVIFIGKDNSPTSFLEKLIISALIWFGVTLWGAILQSKRWVFRTEAFRIVLTAAVMIQILEIHDYPESTQWVIAGATLLNLLWLGYLGKIQNLSIKNLDHQQIYDR